MLFGINLHGNLEKSWTKEGFNKWKNCSFAIQRHELTSDHVTSLKFKLCENNVPILPSIEHHRKNQIAMNKQVVFEFIDIILFLAHNNLAFRGHYENWSLNSKGNFKDLVTLMAKNSAPLAEHINKIQCNGKHETSFISWQRQNQLIESIAEDISFQIRSSVKSAKMFSISIDTTFDASRKEQISFIIRYLINLY